MSVFIFGASGFLGRELRAHLERKRETVIGTYCSSKQPGLRPFDLRRVDLGVFGTDLKTATFAIICCSVTDMDRCKSEWDSTYGVNVEGSKTLISQLQDAGIVPVFISTDYVYDGLKGNYSEDDRREPVLAYGRQKKEVEDFLLSTHRPFIIVRPARIYSLRNEDMTLLTSIAGSLRRGARLRMATDQIFSPSYVEDVCRAIDLLMEKRHFGCYNLCSDSSISRFQLATLLKDRLGIRTGLVSPCLLGDLRFGDKRPPDTSLSNERFVQAVGFRFTTIEESVEELRRMGQPSHSASSSRPTA